MKKIVCILVSILLLLPCMTPIISNAESKSVMLSYSVSAKVIYIFPDGTQTTQKVAPGSTLKEPRHQKRSGYTFIGWKNEATGKMWNFDDPVTEDLRLVACYRKNAVIPQKNNPQKEKPQKHIKIVKKHIKMWHHKVSGKSQTAKTGDEADPAMWLLICMASLCGICVFIRKKRSIFREGGST